MRQLCDKAINFLQMRKVDYGDIRLVRRRTQQIETRNGSVQSVTYEEDIGFGIRVLVDGAWGFAASNRMTVDEITRVADEAIEIARASGTVIEKAVELAGAIRIAASWQSRFDRNPFDVPLEDKLSLLLRADAALRENEAVTISNCFLQCFETNKLFGNTEGARIDQLIVETGGGLAATAVHDGEMQVRSYPNSFRGNYGTLGYEFVERMDLPGNAPRVADELSQIIVAPTCPSGKRTIILEGGQLALQVHESIGHPIEFDRVLGMEAAFAGASFLKPADLGELRYGSKHVSVVADATEPGGLGSFGFDDEGVAARRVDIIRGGIFCGFLTSRETAGVLRETSNGAMRASGWDAIPLIRMTNVSLLPGEWDFDDLLGDTDDGLLMATNRSWSIDDKRLNFQFGAEIAWEIKGGKLGQVYKNPTYTGITPEFWNSCDAVCNRSHYRLFGTPNCGKGEPMQVMHVGHGAAPARFRNVETGVIR